jgi:hypothetical protein
MVPDFLLQEDEPQMLHHSMTVALLANSLNSYKGAPGNQCSIYGGVFFLTDDLRTISGCLPDSGPMTCAPSIQAFHLNRSVVNASKFCMRSRGRQS